MYFQDKGQAQKYSSCFPFKEAFTLKKHKLKEASTSFSIGLDRLTVLERQPLHSCLSLFLPSFAIFNEDAISQNQFSACSTAAMIKEMHEWANRGWSVGCFSNFPAISEFVRDAWKEFQILFMSDLIAEELIFKLSVAPAPFE